MSGAENGDRALPESPEDGATAEAIRRGLRAVAAPDGFTDAVVRRCQEAASQGPRDPRRAPARGPSAARKRLALAAAILVWTASFAIGISGPRTEVEDAIARQLARQDLVRRTGGGDPREQWVKLAMLDDLGHERISGGALSGLAGKGFKLEAFWNGEDPRHYWVIAEPSVPARGDDRYFYIDDEGVIRFRTGGPRWFRVDESGAVRSELGRAPTSSSPLYESGAPSQDPEIGG